MQSIFYIAPTCFSVISPSAGSWHQNFFKAYSNKIGYNKHTYIYYGINSNLLYCFML